MRWLSFAFVLATAGVASAQKPTGLPADPRVRGEVPPAVRHEFYDWPIDRPIADARPLWLHRFRETATYLGLLLPRGGV